MAAKANRVREKSGWPLVWAAGTATVIALAGCGPSDPAPGTSSKTGNTMVNPIVAGGAAVPAGASAAGTEAAASESGGLATSAKPKDMSQDVLKWLQLSPEKSAKADKPDAPVATRAPAPAASPNVTPAPNVMLASNAPASSAPAPGSANPNNASAVSLPRSTPTLIPVSAPAARPGAVETPTPSAAPSPPSAQPGGGAAAAAPGAQRATSASPEPAPTVVASAAPSAVAPSNATAPAAALRLIAREQPGFPRDAIRNGVTKGHVRVRLSVAPDGSVTHVEIIESQPRGVFDKTVTAAALRWKYAPVPEPLTAVAEFDFHSDE